jgi:hypothetical protein
LRPARDARALLQSDLSVAVTKLNKIYVLRDNDRKLRLGFATPCDEAGGTRTNFSCLRDGEVGPAVIERKTGAIAADGERSSLVRRPTCVRASSDNPCNTGCAHLAALRHPAEGRDGASVLF